MSRVQVYVPPGCKVVGRLYDTADVLGGDMIEVSCPNGLVRVGWFPEDDPNGSYYVSAYHDRRKLTTFKTRNVKRVLQVVWQLALHLSVSARATSNIQNIQQTWFVTTVRTQSASSSSGPTWKYEHEYA